MPARNVNLNVYVDIKFANNDAGYFDLPNFRLGNFMQGVAAPNTVFAGMVGEDLSCSNQLSWREEFHIQMTQARAQEGHQLTGRAGVSKDIDRNQYVTVHGTQLSAAVNDASNEVVGSGAFGIKGEHAGRYNTIFFKLDGELVPIYADDDEDKVQKGEGVREYKPDGKYRACWTSQPNGAGTYTQSWPEDSFDFPQPSPEADGSVNMFISYGYKDGEEPGQRGVKPQFYYYGNRDPGDHTPSLSIAL